METPDADPLALIDEAYRVRCSRYGDSCLGPMVATAAQTATLRLAPRNQ